MFEPTDLLLQDFSQVHTQLRGTVDRIFEMFKYAFTIYTAVIGIALSLIQIGNSQNPKIDFASKDILKKSSIVFVLLLIMTMFLAFSLEAVQKNRGLASCTFMFVE